MFLTFLFHRVGDSKYATPKEVLEKHLLFLKKNYSLILPEEPSKMISACISFDDAYFDFYHYVFPFIKREKIPVLLAVSPQYILEDTTLDPKERLEKASSSLPFPAPKPSAVFCTWKELNEMVDSGFVQIASHGYSHKNLCETAIDLEKEIVLSKKILEEKLKTRILSFVYPMGKFNSKVHELVKTHYQYAFRIGSALNFSWNHPHQMFYRIPADHLPSLSDVVSSIKMPFYFMKHFANRFRGK